ncbi:hypothetical protein GCK32_017946 [Trichostrongylus colubriformis]|uniref:Uncharacterized protein n=1 Tax=Trichostrongylus colubriformis TaxID=6319 RepID=A0AAN8FKC3_TRICO
MTLVMLADPVMLCFHDAVTSLFILLGYWSKLELVRKV